MTSADELFSKVRARALRAVVPDSRERQVVTEKVDAVTKSLRGEFARVDARIELSLQGSVAKDTWLRGEVDADVFVIYPPTYEKAEIGRFTIAAARRIFGKSHCTERYAEHPYVTVSLEGGMSADIVPCFASKEGGWKSATDRTPLHTAFVKERFDEHLRNEARLLKRYMKGAGVYGAEIRVGGFSGYLAELLVCHYGSLKTVLTEFARFEPPVVIDFSRSYSQSEASALFGKPLIVIDPTDRMRNVASAVREDALWRFVLSAREFLFSPSLRFFFPRRLPPPTRERLRRELESLEFCPVTVLMDAWERRPDVLWGQLYKTERRLVSRLELEGFSVFTSSAWTDERNHALVVVLLTSCQIPPAEIRKGPHPYRKDSQVFLDEYRHHARTIYGPLTRDGVLYVLRRRRFTSVESMIRAAKLDREFTRGIPPSARRSFRESKVLVGPKCSDLAEVDGFGAFFKNVIVGKPPWSR